MSNIGTFIAQDGKIIGKIQTLTLSASVTFLPNDKQTGPDAPAYRAFRGKSEVGAAWEKVSDSGRQYLSVRFDDPTFDAPLFANLIVNEDSSYTLLWSRPSRR
jgi:uncharacterized protein (DUF736 family)